MDKSNSAPEVLDFATVLASSLHDMKNSLCIFLGMLDEVVEETSDEDPRYGRMVKLRYEGQRIGNDMMQLLGIYRSSQARFSPNIAEVDVTEFLMEQMQVHQLMLEHKQIAAEVVCDSGLVWFFDREMVAGILTNVINNAYKYARGRLRIIGQERDGGLVLSIADDGPGYPPHMLADGREGLPPVDFQNGSTGLGLYFARLVAGLHKNRDKAGHIAITNDGIDSGGCFSVWLP
ncbi:sensor histidine kinase [Methylogaea oryzae]|uniref:histidine kinase n=1 Tax=Methylogaea oryzae TaxID=1295382 RepID=A0A8D4VMA9_9GAMM|nr:HAMP domain-containing sensor histidine kinase [Methylogaea oryzae]BBL70460.1 sensor histidine kinase [Methylogaea oryzae]